MEVVEVEGVRLTNRKGSESRMAKDEEKAQGQKDGQHGE